jgi:hypothetical protein
LFARTQPEFCFIVNYRGFRMSSSEQMTTLNCQDRSLAKSIPDVGVLYSLAAAIVIVASLSLLRIPSMISPQELNVDESQMLSQAMKFIVDPVPWRAVDGTSSGPLNSYFISLFLLIGLKPGYVLVHVLADVLVCFQLLTAHRTLLRLGLWSKRTAACGTLVMVCYFGFTNDLNYLHYSSELLPALLLALGFHGLVVWVQDGPDRSPSFQASSLFLSGLAVGSAPWCKLQALPIAAALGLAVLATSMSGKAPSVSPSGKILSAMTFCAGALLPAGAILGSVAWAGATKDFWYSYILGNLAYAGPLDWARILQHLNWLVSPSGMRLLFVIDAFAIGLFIYCHVGTHTRLVSSKEFWLVGGLLMYGGAALFTVSRPLTLFPHYTIFLLHPMTYLGAWLLSRELSLLDATRQARLEIIYRLMMSAVAAILLTQVVVRSEGLRRLSPPPPDSNERIAGVIQNLKSTRPVASLAIWGWAPGVYVLTGMPPATRDAIGHFVISEGPLQGYFRKRFAGDLRSKMPDLFIDAVAPGAFMWFWKASDGYESDPELRSFIADKYDLIAELPLRPHAKPVRFFARRETGGDTEVDLLPSRR